MKICCGTFHTSPTKSIQNENNEPTLSHRRTELSLKYAVTLSAYPDNPSHDLLFPKQTNSNSDQQTRPPKSIRKIIEEYQSETLIHLPPIQTNKLNPDPPWTLEIPKVDLNLSNIKKNEIPENRWNQLYKEIEEKYSDSTHIFTDGSKTESGAGCSIYSTSQELYFGLPKRYSVFSTEIFALM